MSSTAANSPRMLSIALTLVLLSPAVARAEVGIDEHLGQTVPLDLTFSAEDGESVRLRDLVDRPTILALVYYRCPSICGPLLGGISEVIDRMDAVPGKDYRVVTVSFNPDETPELARQKKINYFKSFHEDLEPSAWRFLTGDEVNISALTQAVGFKYERSGMDFVHPGAITVLSPTGMIVRYLYGVTFLPFDLKMALLEAREGRPSPTVSKVLLYCFSYDPEGKTYAFNLLRVTGTVTLAFIGLFGAFLYLTARSRRRPRGSNNQET